MSNHNLQRPKLRSTQDWHKFLESQSGKVTLADLSKFRIDTYKEIEAVRKRPLIVYFSKFGVPKGIANSIDLHDVDGFTDLVGSINGEDSIDVLVHSPGGAADITERIVAILQDKFKEVHFIIPHSAYSAATMLALSGDSITIHPSATLGPIDPQINGIPARSIKRGFENAKQKIKTEGPTALPAYVPLIQRYSLDLLELCEDAESLSKELVTEWLKAKMMAGKSEVEIKKVVDYFSNYDDHKTHSRPILLSKVKDFGLNIHRPDQNLQELIWEAYLHLQGFMSGSGFFKLYENAYGITNGHQMRINQLQPNVTQPNQNPKGDHGFEAN